MPYKRLPGIEGNYRQKGQKKLGKIFEETSGCVRPERANEWPNCTVATS